MAKPVPNGPLDQEEFALLPDERCPPSIRVEHTPTEEKETEPLHPSGHPIQLGLDDDNFGNSGGTIAHNEVFACCAIFPS